MAAAAKAQQTTPEAPAKSHAERCSEHADAMAALKKTHDRDVLTAEDAKRKADEIYKRESEAAEASHRETCRRELRAHRTRAIAALTEVITPWREEPTRGGTAKIIAAWQAADADARHATGLGLHDHVIAYAFAAAIMAKDPDAVLAFATPGADHTATAASTEASKLLATGDVIEGKHALERLDRAVNAKARGTRVADVALARERWDVLTCCAPDELGAYDQACEKKRQHALAAGIVPLKVGDRIHNGKVAGVAVGNATYGSLAASNEPIDHGGSLSFG